MEARARRLLLVVLIAVAAALSLLRWKTDYRYVELEYCPDSYCEYASLIHNVIREPTHHNFKALSRFCRNNRIATSPTAPALTALLNLAIPSTVASYASVSFLLSMGTLYGFRRSAEKQLGVERGFSLLCGVLLVYHIIFLRGMARPISDATGLFFTFTSLILVAELSKSFNHGRLFYSSVFVFLTLFSRISALPICGFLLAWFLVAYARTRKPSNLECALMLGLFPMFAFAVTTAAFGSLPTLFRALDFARLPPFTQYYTLGGFVKVIVVCLQLYPLLWVQGIRGRSFLRTEAERLHAAWILFYLLFLVAGHGAFWNRYLLPIVPSVLFVSIRPLRHVLATQGRDRLYAAVGAFIAFSLLPLLAQLSRPLGFLLLDPIRRFFH